MKVLFIEPGWFLRTPQRTNPFLDPLIAVCIANGIEWQMWMPSRRTLHGYDIRYVRSYGAWKAVGVFLYRILHYFFRISIRDSYSFIGRIFRLAGAAKYDPDVVVSLSGFGVHVIRTLFPKARAVDVQHGVIYSKHRGYFNDMSRIWPIYWKGVFIKREFWVYGQGYADCFFRHPDNVGDLAGRVKIVGDVVRAGKEERKSRLSRSKRNLIVVASQLTHDFKPDALAEMKKEYEKAFVEAHEYGEVVFRHHPRFSNCIDLGDWNERFPWVVMTDVRPWEDVLDETICLITINSTVAFDAAAQGVPTAMLDDACIGHENLMKNEYGYPLADRSVSDLASLSPDEWDVASHEVRKWYEHYYTPFSDENCLQLLMGKTEACN